MRTKNPAGPMLRAGLIAAVVSGAPSTVHAIVTRRDPLEATAAAGSLVLRGPRSRRDLLFAAVPTHVAISMLWTYLLGSLLPRRARILTGALYGVGIGFFDLRVVGAAAPRIRALPLGAQIADHALFGAVVGGLTRPSRDP